MKERERDRDTVTHLYVSCQIAQGAKSASIVVLSIKVGHAKKHVDFVGWVSVLHRSFVLKLLMKLYVLICKAMWLSAIHTQMSTHSPKPLI